VASHRHRAVKPAEARALDEGSPEAGNAADQMDDAGAGEVDDARPEEELPGRPARGRPPVGGPEPVGRHRVHEAGEEGGVGEVRHELRPLGDGARRDAGGGDGEGPLEEEEVVAEAGLREAPEAEEVAPDEAVGGRPEGEGEAEEVVEERAGGGVEDVGEHDVDGVLGLDGARAEHGEDEVGGEEQVRRVHGR